MHTKILIVIIFVFTLLAATVALASEPVHQVSAGGKLDLEGGNSETYGFLAQIDAEGIVSGQGEFHEQGQLKIHFEVNCLSVDGNTAWLGGIVTRSNDPVRIPVGFDFTWQLQDNGEGTNAAPDLQSFILPTELLPALGFGSDCNDQGNLFSLALFEWGKGNIQVK
ncbi:MAG: hypothetical protein JSV42_12900 [Chloroflexota bacterium]|nr:MAG: hypothetical protein JSV42_12900 [Chloroflexota bacterium]